MDQLPRTFIVHKNIFSSLSAYQHIFEPVFSAKDTGISYRNLSNWDQKDMLGIQRDDNHQWRKFNFVQYTWIRIIEELRAFGIRLNTIQQYNGLYAPGIEQFNIKEASTGRRAALVFLDEHGRKHVIPPADGIDEVLYIESTCSLLAQIIFDYLARPKPMHLLFCHNGSFAVRIDGNLFHLGGEFDPLSFIQIDLWKVIKSFVKKEAYQDLVRKYQLLTEDELDIIRLIRKGEVTSIRITYHDHNDVEWVDKNPKDHLKDLEDKLLRLLREGQYKKIILKTGNKEVLYHA